MDNDALLDRVSPPPEDGAAALGNTLSAYGADMHRFSVFLSERGIDARKFGRPDLLDHLTIAPGRGTLGPFHRSAHLDAALLLPVLVREGVLAASPITGVKRRGSGARCRNTSPSRRWIGSLPRRTGAPPRGCATGRC